MSGYLQVACTMVGVVVSILGIVPAIKWYSANWARMQELRVDPMQNLLDIWVAVRWAVLGLAIFGFGWLWALATSMGILNEAKRAEKEGKSIPPKLDAKPIPPKLT